MAVSGCVLAEDESAMLNVVWELCVSDSVSIFEHLLCAVELSIIITDGRELTHLQ